MWSIGVISLNTFRENLRDKILYNLLFFAVFLIGGAIALGDLTVMEHDKIISDIGLASINLIGIIIAIFVGTGLVSREIDRRTVYTIMARPIHRVQFLLGKYLGLVVTLVVNVVIMLIVYLATLWSGHVPIRSTVFQAVQLMLVEMLVITAVALMFSTFSTATLSAIFTIGVYIVGHLTEDLKAIAERSPSATIKGLMSGLYYIFPNLEMLNIKGQAASGISVSIAFQSMATVYGLLYATLLLVGGCLIFQRRDF
ncbi:MAG TPA: ABC transporter permease subunit [Nitrospiraceae bacterium]|nr:ABC transporter permease subunit [Nitrospiraceae bacterium]